MKKVLPIALAVLLLITLIGSGTLAYFTDTEDAVNVIASGNIQILQHELVRNTQDGSFTDDLISIAVRQETTPLFPAPEADYTDTLINGQSYQLRDADASCYADKIITVENVGDNDAYVRTFIAVPTGSVLSSSPMDDNWLHWDGYAGDDSWHWGLDAAEQHWPASTDGWHLLDDTVINEQVYDVYVTTYTQVLKVGQTTPPNLLGYYLDGSIDQDENGYQYDGVSLELEEQPRILISTQAVQVTTFSNPWTALDTVFGAPAPDNHPWLNDQTTFIDSNEALQQALSQRVSSGHTFRLAPGTYDLPEKLPEAIRIVGDKPGVTVNASKLEACYVDISNVTVSGNMEFTGCGEFNGVVFQGDFHANFDNPGYIHLCSFHGGYSYAVTADALRDTVVFEDNADGNGNPVSAP